MPELPEVETIKNDLKQKIVGKIIIGGWTDWPKMIKQPLPDQFFSKIKNLKIVDVSRRAKNIIFHLDNGMFLLAHLKMTGHFLVAQAKYLKDNSWQSDESYLADRVNQFIHLALYLNNGEVMAFSDMRKFGWLKLMKKNELDEALSSFGPEPLEDNFTYEAFLNVFFKKKGKVKKVLMDQKVIAGIGNIYADEILWQAKINPFRDVTSLSKVELKAIFNAIKQVLGKAVELRGTSTSDYRDVSGAKGSYGEVRHVYRLTGKPCHRDKTLIERKKLNGRSTHFCPVCQK